MKKEIIFLIIITFIISFFLFQGQRIFRPINPNDIYARYGKSPYSGPPFLYFGSTSYNYRVADSRYNSHLSYVDAAFSSWNSAGPVQFSRSTSGLPLSAEARSISGSGPAWSNPGVNPNTNELLPQNGIIVLNTNYTWSHLEQHLGANPPVLDVQTMVVHEAGHIMGLAHPLTDSYDHDDTAPTMAGGDNAYFDNTLECRSLESEDVDGTKFLQLRVPTHYPTLQSAIDAAEDIEVGYIYLVDNYTLTSDAITTVDDINVVLKSGITLNLNGHSLIASGGHVLDYGATINGLRATLRANTVLRGLCGRIQTAANYAGTTYEIDLENGNFNENVTINNKDNLAMSGNENYTHFGTLTVSFCDVFQAAGLGAKSIHINYGSYLVLHGLFIDGINQSADGFYLFNSDTYDVAFLTSMYSSTGIVCTDGTEADFDYPLLSHNLVGLVSINGSNVDIYNSFFCGTALDLKTYNFSSITASSCYFDGGTPSTSGSNIWHYGDQSCSLAKTARQTANTNDEISIVEENGSDFEKINSNYFALNKRLSNAFKEKTDFNKEAFCADYGKVITDFQEFISNNPDSPLARIALIASARSYRRIDNLRGKSDLMGMKNFLNDIIENTKYPDLKQQAEKLMIDYYRLTNDFTGAVKEADNVIEKYKEDADYVCGALYGKGLIQAYNLDKPQEAADCFAQIVRDYPDNSICEMAKNELRILGYDEGLFEEENASLANQEEFKINSFPNPFNPVTTIQYNLPKDVNVMLEVFNVQGQKVKTLVNSFQKAGSYDVQFDGSKLASGVYIYKIKAGKHSLSKRMLLIK